MTNKNVCLKNGFEIQFQRIDKKVSHIIIYNSRTYPDEDSRSEERWRREGLLIPINNDKDIKRIKKLFK